MENKGAYLPIGSVVLLNEGNKRLMIFGIIQSEAENPSVEYDYIGVPYPEGNMGDEHQYLFYHKDIKALIELVADICKRNGIKKLVWSNSSSDRINHKNGCNMTVHRDFASTDCPGEYLYSRMADIAKKVNEKLGAKTTTQTSAKTTTSKASSFLPARGYFMKGDESPNVGKIATFMRKMFPSYTSEKALGNLYGTNLISAIKEFQRRTGLEADGCTGKLTLAMLEKYGFKY